MNHQIFNSKQLNPDYNLPKNTQNQKKQNTTFPNQTINTPNNSIQNHIYNYQGQTIVNLQKKEPLVNIQCGNNINAKPNYINNNKLGNNQGNIENNFKCKNNVVPIFDEANERQNKAIPFKKKPDSQNKIKIIFKGRYDDSEVESKKNVKFEEVVPSYYKKYLSYYEFIFHGKIIDKNKTLAELDIYNNSEIFIAKEKIQDLLIMDHSPLNDGNNNENEKQIIYFYLTLDQENSTKYKILIQSKKVRTLWEVFLNFNKKIGVKHFNIISFISIDISMKATNLDYTKRLGELGIKNHYEILILIKQNIWIIDENPLITHKKCGYNFISKEKLNIIKILIFYHLDIIIIQCSKERLLKEIALYLKDIFSYGNKDILFEFDGNELNQDKNLSELDIKNGDIINANDKFDGICYCISRSTEYIMEDMVKYKNKKEEIKYIAIIFIKNEETFKFMCKSDKKFKEIALKFMKETREIKQYNFYCNGKIIFDENKTLNELNIENFSKIIVKDVIQLINLHNKNKIEKKEKYDLNILYYDENLLNKENSDNCSFLSMNMNGTFYGCHYFEIFKIICEKIKRNKNQIILISSGSSAQKIFDYCSNINEIREYLIFCFDEEKYKPLMNKYPKLKGIYSNFYYIIDILYSLSPIKMNNISSSNLIFFEDYSRIYIKLHYEFIQKYSLYKII